MIKYYRHSAVTLNLLAILYMPVRKGIIHDCFCTTARANSHGLLQVHWTLQSSNISCVYVFVACLSIYKRLKKDTCNSNRHTVKRWENGENVNPVSEHRLVSSQLGRAMNWVDSPGLPESHQCK